MKPFRAPCIALLLGGAVVGACTSFGAGGTGAPSDAGLDTATETDSAAITLPGDSATEAGPPRDRCRELPKGAGQPCKAPCTTEEVYAATSGPDAFGPYIFGIAVDETYVYWIEQFGQSSVTGVGERSVLRRKGIAAPSLVETLGTYQAAFSRMVVTKTAIWLGSFGTATRLKRITKPCSTLPCAATDVGETVVARSMAPYDGGVAIANGAAIVVYGEDGKSARTRADVPAAIGIVEWKTGLAYVSEEQTSRTTIRVLDSPETRALLVADPAGRPSLGATSLAASCDDLWAYQTFDPLIQGTFPNSAFVLTASAGPIGVPIKNKDTFGFAADATHLYGAHPERGGLSRVAVNAPTFEEVALGISAWSLAVDDTHVYFDDHGSRTGSLKSTGIYRIKKSE